ncbi:hypothetical protein FHR99_001140 [Litorivivens lipolytica]|uniref:Short-chain dehydrogenase n=1 Tax=Litorivivens lipolytica TaxID=1524264 RepID=A0A7W4W4T5_9GAMM|nr:SDR family NAD(P)-dependent oxidoreductase [Litorivivens lipolytica]MBB3046904.1 hypothetical protein [Litorivivens lipolytica]
MGSNLKGQYGPWALIAGAAQGIGRAWAAGLGAQGLNLVLIDRNRELLDQACLELERETGASCHPIVADLGSAESLGTIVEGVGAREIGMLVYNAALADVGPFFKADLGLDYELTKAQVNMLSPLVLVHHFAQPMLARKRGGIVLMSSGSGLQGAPFYSHYAATKAYNIVLAESLWHEFKPYNVDVMACIAGMTLSPGVASAVERGEGQHSIYQTPEEVVAEGLQALGSEPSHICGVHNRDNQAALNGLPRGQAVAAIAQHAIRNFLDNQIPEQQLDLNEKESA